MPTEEIPGGEQINRETEKIPKATMTKKSKITSTFQNRIWKSHRMSTYRNVYMLNEIRMHRLKLAES